MTSTAWNNIPAYGKKLKRDFTHLDKLTKKAFATENLQPIELETLLKMLYHKRNLAMTITKMIEVSDTTHRLDNIEKLLNTIPGEILAKAKENLGI